jgi:hypothetical protein
MYPAKKSINILKRMIKIKKVIFYRWTNNLYLAVDGGGGGERTILVGSPSGKGFAPGGRSLTILTGTEGTGGPTDNE